MQFGPETRQSLVLRLQDPDDVGAWDEFVSIYRPLVYRLAVKRGFQHADAEELSQEVMLSVSQAIDAWLQRPQHGRFRPWLFTIARNLMVNWMTRGAFQPIGTGETATWKLLEAQPAPTAADSREFDLEYQREIFRWAAERVRPNVHQKTWQAFWLSSVESFPIQAVAEQLGMTIGSVYVSRSRVAARIRSEVQQFEKRSGTSVPVHSE